MRADAARIPLVIGTSGHRDPLDPAKILGQVEQVFGELDCLAPDVPFCVLTPLAVGGDRIVADAALRLRARRMAAGPFKDAPDGGVELIAVLPFQLEDYRLDFRSAEDRAEFEHYFGQMDGVVELPIHDGANVEEVARDEVVVRAVDGGRFGRDRNEGYERLGRFMAIRSHILIAMWNGWNTGVVGADRTGIGGTSAIVQFCCAGNAGDKVGGVPLHADISPILISPRTPVAWVFTGRKSDSERGREDLEEALERQIDLRSGSTISGRIAAAARWSGVDEMHSGKAVPALGSFERARVRGTRRDDWEEFSSLLRSLRDLNVPLYCSDLQMDGVPRDLLAADHGLSQLLAMFARLDALAIVRKREFEHGGRLALSLLVAAIFAFQLFSSWSWAIFVLAYLVLLVWSRSPCRSAKRVEWSRAEVRCLAELVRVQVACRLAGASTPISDFFDERRVQRVKELGMLVRATLVRAMLAPPAHPPAFSGERLQAFITFFLTPQIAFSSDDRLQEKRAKEARAERSLQRARFATLGTAVFALVVSLLHEFGVTDAFGASGLTDELLLPFLNLIAAGSLLTVFFIDTQRSLFGTRQSLEAAEATRPLFEMARAQLERAESERTVRAVVSRICNSATDEQLEWYIMRRDGAELDALG